MKTAKWVPGHGRLAKSWETGCWKRVISRFPSPAARDLARRHGPGTRDTFKIRINSLDVSRAPHVKSLFVTLPPVRILLVDDNPDDIEISRRILAESRGATF